MTATASSMADDYAREHPMTRQELRVLLDKWFCGCGQPQAAAAALLRLLRLHPLYENRSEFAAWVPDSGVEHLLLYQIDRLELTEHGGSVGGGWLTNLGAQVRDALAREEADGFEELTDQYCVHGYDIDDDSHDCFAEDDK